MEEKVKCEWIESLSLFEKKKVPFSFILIGKIHIVLMKRKFHRTEHLQLSYLPGNPIQLAMLVISNCKTMDICNEMWKLKMHFLFSITMKRTQQQWRHKKPLFISWRNEANK